MIASPKLPSSSETFISNLVEKLCQLQPSQQRAFCSILGSAVADAATRPFHWVYNRTVLEDVVQQVKEVEFWPQSISPYYTLPTGRRSCYHDLGLAMLRALPAECSMPVFNEKAFIEVLLHMFSPSSEYATAMLRRKEAYDPAKRTEDRKPIDGPWQQAAVTAFLEDISAGQRPSGNPTLLETDGLCCTLPLIARLAAGGGQRDGSMDLQLIHSAASILSSNPISLVHTLSSAILLQSVIQGAVPSPEHFLSLIKDGSRSIDQSWIQESEKKLNFNNVYNELTEIENSIDEDYVNMVEIFGKPCANPGSFMGAVLAVLQSVQEGETLKESVFANGIRKIIRGGGCNCSRANLAGALLGAFGGIYLDRGYEKESISELCSSDNMKGIPISWILQTDNIEEIVELAFKAAKKPNE